MVCLLDLSGLECQRVIDLLSSYFVFRFGEESVQRMVDFVDEARDEGLFPESPSVLDIGENIGDLQGLDLM